MHLMALYLQICVDHTQRFRIWELVIYYSNNIGCFHNLCAHSHSKSELLILSEIQSSHFPTLSLAKINFQYFTINDNLKHMADGYCWKAHLISDWSNIHRIYRFFPPSLALYGLCHRAIQIINLDAVIRHTIQTIAWHESLSQSIRFYFHTLFFSLFTFFVC